MSFPELILVLVASFGNFSLGIFTLLRNPRSATNKLFFIFSITMVGYLFSNFFINYQQSGNGAFLWVRIVMSLALFINLFFFLLVKAFPHHSLKISSKTMLLLYGLTICLLPVTTSNLIFKEISIEGGKVNSIPGDGMPLFLLHTLLYLGGGFILLVKKFRNSRQLERVRTQFFLIATIFMFLAIMLTNVVFVVFFSNAQLIGMLPVYSMIFLGIISYSIIKHQFLDIRLVVMRSVSYAFSVLLLAIIFSGSFFLVQSLIFGVEFGAQQLLLSMGLAMFMMFTFQPLRNWFERSTSGFFYRSAMSPQEFLEIIGRDIASHLEFSNLVNVVLQRIQDQLKTSNMHLVTLDKSWKGLFKKVKFVIERPQDIDEMVDLVKNLFESGPRRIIFEEVEDEKVKEIMRKHQIGIILPLMVNYKLIGGLIVGQKQSGGMFSTTELESLEILTPQLATGVQNALSYEKIRRFNETLKEKVDLATSELRESHLKLQRSYRRLKELDQLKDEFVSIASHELRTPLTAIRGYIWMAMNKSEAKLPKKVEKNLQVALESSDHLAKLVEDMLTISRIEGKRLILEKEKFDLVDLSKTVHQELAIRAEEKHIKFTFNSEEKEVVIKADKEKIREVLINLIGNALKFTPEKGEISFSVEKKSKKLVIKVSDTGPGISKDDQKKLFQKFSRLDHSYQKTSETGTGLGLYITQQIIQLHDGDIFVESELGKGTCFIVELPV